MSDVPDRVDVPLVDAAVVFINQAVAEKVFIGSLDIGAYLLKTFFNNDIELAASRDSNKPASYSALCSRPELAVSRWTLSRMVRVAAQEKFLKSKRIQTARLSYAQRMELIKLPNDDRKVELVRHCISQGLSTHDLIPLISQACQESAPPPKPVSPATAAKRHVRELQQLMSGSDVPAFLHDRNQLKSLPRDIRRSLQETASALLVQAPNIVRLYENLLRNLEEITVELEEL